MHREEDLRRQLSALPLDVFRCLPLLGRIMIAARDDVATLERIGTVERLERDGNTMFCVGEAHDCEVDLGVLSSVVVDYSSQMKGKVLPKIEFQDDAGQVVFSVVGLEGSDKFTLALKAFDGVAIAPRPKTESETSILDSGDAALLALKSAQAAEAEITVEVRRPGVTQRWRGLVPDINPAMGFVNIITSDFHLHLRGGGVTGWKRSAVGTDGSIELAAMGRDGRSLDLFLRGPASAFGPV